MNRLVLVTVLAACGDSHPTDTFIYVMVQGRGGAGISGANACLVEDATVCNTTIDDGSTILPLDPEAAKGQIAVVASKQGFASAVYLTIGIGVQLPVVLLDTTEAERRYGALDPSTGVIDVDTRQPNGIESTLTIPELPDAHPIHSDDGYAFLNLPPGRHEIFGEHGTKPCEVPPDGDLVPPLTWPASDSGHTISFEIVANAITYTVMYCDQQP